jgi:hypothetical protein
VGGKRLVLAAALCFAGVLPAGAVGVSCGSVVIQKGSACQYVTSTGPIRACVVADSGTGSTWNLMVVTGAHAWTSVLNVPNDQTQLMNNSFAVISCQVPF